jgi:DNA-binding transcriptional MerR regulator
MQAGLIERPDMRGRVHKTYEEQIPKLYWKIGEVADMLGIEPSMIRFWLAEFEFDAAKKNKDGVRFFNADEVAKIREIHRLLKVEFLTIRGARKKLQNG